MTDYQFFFILLGAILGVLISIAWFLHRILNILIMKNRGEPTSADINKLSFDNMAKNIKQK